jgi:Beta-lactamase enzyme family
MVILLSRLNPDNPDKGKDLLRALVFFLIQHYSGFKILIMRVFLSVFFLVLIACQPPLVEDENFLANLMKRDAKKFQNILNNADTLQVQIIYTQINRDSINRPNFKSFYFRADSNNYFYPASTVKLPMVLLALEKLNQLQQQGVKVDKFTPVFHDSVYAGQQSVKMDTTASDSLPTIAHYAKKILVVSDNDAYNRLYEFVGQRETNLSFQQKGYLLKLFHRLERPLSPDQNRHTEAVRFVRHDSVIYKQPMLVNTDSIKPRRKVYKGKGFIKSDSVLVEKPFDFTYKNDYSLFEQQEILKAILFPNFIDERKRFNISEADRRFVMQYMSQLPTETISPPYKKDTALYDAYCKFLMYGEDKKSIPKNIRIFNKVGDAYGYLIDNAYIVDFENGVEFMLSAVINTNTDGIYNDGKYEYKTIGYPFMKNLGQAIYKHELKRKKKFKPDLSAYFLEYENNAKDR